MPDEPITEGINDLFDGSDFMYKTIIDSVAIAIGTYGIGFLKPYITFEDSITNIFRKKAVRGLVRGIVRGSISLMIFMTVDAMTNNVYKTAAIYKPVRYIEMGGAISAGFGLGFAREFKRS